VLFSCFILTITGCNAKFIRNSGELNEKQLKEKLINGELYRDTESLYFVENNILMYGDKEDHKKQYGAWYIRKVKSMRHGDLHDAICIIRGTTKKFVTSSTKAVCMRLNHVEDPVGHHDNLYLSYYYHCTNVLSKDSLPLCYDGPFYGHFRIAVTKREK
jgi:hypothetical protein